MRLALGALAVAALLAVWTVAANSLAASGDLLAVAKLPAPGQIAQRFVSDWETLLEASAITLAWAIAGFGLGTLIGVVLAVIMVQSRWAELAVMPYVLAAQMLPLIALVPILAAVTRNAEVTRLLVAAFVTFFAVAIAALKGLKTVEPAALELMASLSASRLAVLRLVRFPSAVPYLFTGLRVAAPLSLVGAIVVDLQGARNGLGYLMLTALTFGPRQATMLWAAMILALVLGLGLFHAVTLLERLAVPWHTRRQLSPS